MHETRSTLYIITEMGFGGDLLDAISHRNAYSEDVARKMFANMLSAMAYLHEQGIMHRDISVAKYVHTEK